MMLCVLSAIGVLGSAMAELTQEPRPFAPKLRRSLSSLLDLADHSHGSFDVSRHVQVLQKTFPGCVPERLLVDHMSTVLESHGFGPAHSINMVSTCRDEICSSLMKSIDERFGKPSFDISSLAGMVFCGRTGFKAAMTHAPSSNRDSKERYVFWVAPHMAFSGENAPGEVWRPGQEKISHACGALLAVQESIRTGKLGLRFDEDDLEMSFLKQEAMNYIEYGSVPSLVNLTYAIHQCISDRVRHTAADAVNLERADYVIISGIQVHAGFSENFFWPGSVTKYSAAGTEDLMEQYRSSVSQDKGYIYDGLVMVRIDVKSNFFFRF